MNSDSSGGGQIQGEGHQDGPFALAEVVAGRLAGGDGIAENAQDVVAKLEGFAQRQGEGGVAAEQFVGGAAQRAAEGERMLRGVLGRLEADDGLGPADGAGAVPPRAGDLFQDVEVLPGHHFGPHEVEDQPRPAAGGRACRRSR